MSPTIQLRASTDNTLLDSAVPSQRIIEITLKASTAPISGNRSPLNLALVIDRSGSMAGEKLAYVKQAACHVLGLLDARDYLAIYAFDDKVRRVASSNPLTLERRDDLRRRLQQLDSGGMTNLFDGWLAGAEAVAMHLREEAINRVLLLSDGQANRGKTDLEELAHHTEELYRRGVSTSTFGVGLDYNERLLEAMGGT